MLFRIGLAVFILTYLCGCSHLHMDNLELQAIATDEAQPAGGAFQVKVDGASLMFHAPQVAASKLQSYLPRINQLLKNGERTAARELVFRHPEQALETLRGNQLATGNDAAAVRFIAEEYDRWLNLSLSQGWSVVFSATNRDTAVRNYVTARGRLLESLPAGSPDESLANELLHLADASGYEMLRIDAARTAATAHLVALRNEQAVGLLSNPCLLAERTDRYQCCQLLLLRSDALRRAGQTREADVSWREAVLAAAELAKLQPPLFDPAFWDTASYLRPVSVDWPEPAVIAISSLTPIRFNALTEVVAERESVIWGAIGLALLDRGDHEATLVALKRAEAATHNSIIQDWLRLSEANALARMGQISTATAMLAAQLNTSDPGLAAAGFASLGSIKCQLGDVEAGCRLLKKGIESNALEGWTGLADAEADLGLVCLVRGEEASGIRWLHSARTRYEARGEATRLKQTLVNEREYWKFRKETARLRDLDTRIAAIDAPRP